MSGANQESRQARRIVASLLIWGLIPSAALAATLEIRLYQHGAKGSRVVYVTHATPSQPASGSAGIERWLVDLPNALFAGGTIAIGNGQTVDDLEVVRWTPKSVRLSFALPPGVDHGFPETLQTPSPAPVVTRVAKAPPPPQPRFGLARRVVGPDASERLYVNLTGEQEDVAQKLPIKRAGRTAHARLQGRTPSSAWRWRTSSQLLAASNVLKFSPGPSAMGASLSLRGSTHRPVPWARGFLTGHVEQQALRFTDARYDYGALSLSAALNHPLTPSIYLFEGGSLIYSQADFSPGANFFDNSLYAGVGTVGLMPIGGIWYSSLTADRVLTQGHRDSYYGQAARLGMYRSLLPGLTLQALGTVQRVDPLVRATPYARTFLQGTLEAELGKGWGLGVGALMGAQSTADGLSGFAHVGPFLQISF